MNRYRICGLNVASQMPLSGAIAVGANDTAVDVFIRRGTVPEMLPDALVTGETWQMAEGRFLLRIPRLVRFLVSGGREITIELEPEACERDAFGFVLGSGFGALLHQRGDFVLHASAVARDGRAIAFCGVSGAGKSTLAAALCRKGYALATDDLCVIGFNAHGVPVVQPDGRRLKLWKESIDQLGLTERRCDAVQDRFEKYYVEPLGTALEPPMLSALYVLCDIEQEEDEKIERLSLADAMRILECQVYRPELREHFCGKRAGLAQAAKLLTHIDVFLLPRRRGFEHLPRSLTLLQSHWSTLGRLSEAC